MSRWGSKPQRVSLPGGDGVTNLIFSRRNLERTTTEGDSPVGGRDGAPVGELEYHGTRGIPWETGETTL